MNNENNYLNDLHTNVREFIKLEHSGLMPDMVQPISDHEKNHIVELYVTGLLTIREISLQTGRSVGAISSILQEARRRDPSLDELRSFRSFLKKSNLSPIEFVRQARILEKLDAIDISIQEFSEFLKILEGHGPSREPFMKAAEDLYELERKTRKPYKQVVREYEEKQKFLAEAERRIDELKPEEERLRRSIRSHKELKRIQDTLDQSAISADMLHSYIETHKSLGKIGFTLHIASDVAKGLSKLGMTSKEAVELLAEILAKYPDLKMAIEKLEQDKQTILKQVSSLTYECKTLVEKKGNIEESINTLLESTSTHQEKVASLQKEEHELTQERDGVTQKISELEEKVRHIESMLNAKATVGVLAWLMNDPEKAGEPKLVFSVVLTLLRGLEIYTKGNRNAIRYSYRIPPLIRQCGKAISDEIRYAK